MNTLIKYVVTDPCYILSDDKWDECCKFLDDSPKAFNEAVSKALTDLSGFPAFACDTGFGDWSNKIYGSYIKGVSLDVQMETISVVPIIKNAVTKLP